MDLKEKYLELKDKVIDRFEYWSNNYIANDISEVGRVEYLINKQDEYLFCLDLELELKLCIEDVLNEETNELLIKFIELKKIVDTKIQNSDYFKQNDLDEIFSEYETITINPQFYSNIKLNEKLKNSEIFIEKLFIELNSNCFIKNIKKDFNSLFSKSNAPIKIEWLKTETDLVWLMYLLNFNKFLCISNEPITKITHKYFHLKGKPLNPDSLQTLFSRVKKNDTFKKQDSNHSIKFIFEKLRSEVEFN